MKYLAAIDIGSNALRLAIAKVSPQNLHIALRLREPVRLGSDVFAQGKLSPETYRDLKLALMKFKNQIENFNVKHYRAIATSAMREARNAKDIVTQLKNDTGIQVEVIDGQEEAQLVFQAISHKIDLETKNHLLIDIGGGSIELVAIHLGKILKKASFPLGTVRTIALHKEHGKTPMAQWFQPHLKKQLQPFFEGLPSFEVCVGTGGNMDRFAKIQSTDPQSTLAKISLSDVLKMVQQVATTSIDERIETFQIRRDRADVIEPALLATKTIMEMAQGQELKLPQVGLKEALLLQLAKKE